MLEERYHSLSIFMEESVVSSLVGWINQPIVKQNIKNVLSAPTLAFGCYGLYNLFQRYLGHPSIEKQMNSSTLAHVSLITTALMTPLGIKIPEKIFCLLTSADQRLRWFGPNTVFEHNPLHPRHVMSFINLAMALPSVIKVCHYGISKLRSKPLPTIKREDWMAFWNALTSRPLQHFVNAIFLKDLSRVYRR